jgi:hypothetical protein
MTHRAILREARIYMFRILGAVVSIDVAACAILRKVCIHSAFMACVARNRRVAARQRILGCSCVIKGSACPRVCVVAVRTRCRKLRCFMIRIRC